MSEYELEDAFTNMIISPMVLLIGIFAFPLFPFYFLYVIYTIFQFIYKLNQYKKSGKDFHDFRKFLKEKQEIEKNRISSNFPSQQPHPYYDRTSSLNLYTRPHYIDVRTTFYENQGYSSYEAQEKAKDDFSSDYDPMRNQN